MPLYAINSLKSDINLCGDKYFANNAFDATCKELLDLPNIKPFGSIVFVGQSSSDIIIYEGVTTSIEESLRITGKSFNNARHIADYDVPAFLISCSDTIYLTKVNPNDASIENVILDTSDLKNYHDAGYSATQGMFVSVTGYNQIHTGCDIIYTNKNNVYQAYDVVTNLPGANSFQKIECHNDTCVIISGYDANQDCIITGSKWVDNKITDWKIVKISEFSRYINALRFIDHEFIAFMDDKISRSPDGYTWYDETVNPNGTDDKLMDLHLQSSTSNDIIVGYKNGNQNVAVYRGISKLSSLKLLDNQENDTEDKDVEDKD